MITHTQSHLGRSLRANLLALAIAKPLPPILFVNDEPGGKDILVQPEARRRVLDAVQLRRVAGCLGDDVQPELVVEVARFLPLVGREANSPRADIGLDLDVTAKCCWLQS